MIWVVAVLSVAALATSAVTLFASAVEAKINEEVRIKLIEDVLTLYERSNATIVALNRQADLLQTMSDVIVTDNKNVKVLVEERAERMKNFLVQTKNEEDPEH